MSGETQLVNSIFADADAQIKKILDDGYAAVAAEEKIEEAEAEAARAELLRRAKEKADKLYAREKALAVAEARRILLEAREMAVRKVFDRINEELAEIHGNAGQYPKLLQALAAEAVRGVGEPNVKLVLAGNDRGIADEIFLEDVRQILDGQTDCASTIELSFDALNCSGGCIASGRNGRILFDNTFTQRFERAKPSLRTEIIREMMKCHE